MSINNIKIISLSVFLYLTLLSGFFLNESLNGGAYLDWMGTNKPPIEDFSKNFYKTLINYDEYGHRHSPTYLIFLSSLLRFDLSLETVRLVHLHLSIFLVPIFYKCLELKFKDVENSYLILLSLLIFLSPTFRSLSIWPDSRVPGLLFFTITLYFYLKYEQTSFEKYIWLTSIFLIVTSYISPNFCVFFIYFFYNIFKKMSIRKILLFFTFNIFAALPILYYIFIMKVNFLIAGGTPLSDTQSGVTLNFNFADKILIISSIALFHFIPILISKSHYLPFLNFLKNKFIILFLALMSLVYFFDYKMGYTGGGVFFHLSNYFFDNNYFFYGISFISLSFIFYICKLNIRNLYIFLILILSNIQNTIYHKYYEPLLIIIFFTILKNVDAENLLKDKKNIYNLYALSLIFIAMKIYKNYYLNY